MKPFPLNFFCMSWEVRSDSFGVRLLLKLARLKSVQTKLKTPVGFSTWICRVAINFSLHISFLPIQFLLVLLSFCKWGIWLKKRCLQICYFKCETFLTVLNLSLPSLSLHLPLTLSFFFFPIPLGVRRSHAPKHADTMTHYSRKKTSQTNSRKRVEIRLQLKLFSTIYFASSFVFFSLQTGQTRASIVLKSALRRELRSFNGLSGYIKTAEGHLYMALIELHWSPQHDPKRPCSLELQELVCCIDSAGRNNTYYGQSGITSVPPPDTHTAHPSPVPLP